MLHLCRELLPPLAGTGEAGSAELLGSVYELILLHAGRGTLATDGGSSPAIGELLRVTFPRLRRLLLIRPSDLPAALSNAVENLGDRGLEMARFLATLEDQVTSGDELLDAGAVMAWRLGEARLRTTALVKARQLAPQIVWRILGLRCSIEAASKVFAVLTVDSWIRLTALAQRRWTETGVAVKRRCSAIFEATAAISDKPPLLLDPGDQRSRHRFWRSGIRTPSTRTAWLRRPDTADFPAAKSQECGKRANTSCVETDDLVPTPLIAS